MKTILLDTSFILTALEHRIDIIGEIHRLVDSNVKIMIIDKTLREFNGKEMEGVALQYIKQNNIQSIATDEDKNVDSLLLSHATPEMMVATQDKGLKEKLKKRRIGVITIRQQRYLHVV